MVTISLCTIVKHEAQNLARCLESVKAQVDEIAIVDTGSTDNTVAISKSYGDKIDYFPWCDDFASARNYSLSKATCEWILVLDADQELVLDSTETLNFKPRRICDLITEDLRLNPRISAYFIPEIDVNQENLTTPRMLRLFRNHLDIKYVGRFHEILDLKHYQSSLLADIQVLHYGHSHEAVEKKNASRNTPLLEQMRQEEGLSLRLLACLADMYETILQSEEAEDCYREAFTTFFAGQYT